MRPIRRLVCHGLDVVSGGIGDSHAVGGENFCQYVQHGDIGIHRILLGFHPGFQVAGRQGVRLAVRLAVVLTVAQDGNGYDDLAFRISDLH